MDPSEVREFLEDSNPEALFMDGCDSALVGVAQRCGQPDLAIYSWEKLIKHFMSEFEKDGCENPWESAQEWVSYNCNAWMGQHTPIIMHDVGESDLSRIHA